MNFAAPIKKQEYLEKNVAVPLTPEVKFLLQVIAAKCTWEEVKAVVEQVEKL